MIPTLVCKNTKEEVKKLITLFIRTLITYFLLVLVMRMMGKRQIGELQLSELVITLLLSELASSPIADPDIPLLHAVIPILILLSLEVIVSFVVVKIPFLKTVFDGRPSIIIRRGKINQKELKKLRISMEELMGQARLKNVFNIDQVDYLILEQNGQFSVQPKAEYQNVTVGDLKISGENSGIAYALIVDGKINEYSLAHFGKDLRWLEKRLNEHKCKADDLFLFSADDSGKEYLVKKVKE
ncbi:MAG: DUF421 domain-containing protein [Ruminococcaceae bacterium]|nr:DUF421 domain-containing protein [Oscillospiraceae bacterium]